MPRFFINGSGYEVGGRVTLVGDDAYHIARSLRMAVGDALTVADAQGYEYGCTLCRIRDEECELEIKSRERARSEMPCRITLYMAYPKSDKLETVVQKAVELGCGAVVPFESSRCIKRPQKDKVEQKTRRLCKIAEEAAKQCGRARLTTVAEPIDFGALLERIPHHELALFCYEGEGTASLKTLIRDRRGVGDIAVIVGSEGGFSAEEAEKIVAAGALAANLGPRILRCETAPAYVLSAISYEFEL